MDWNANYEDMSVNEREDGTFYINWCDDDPEAEGLLIELNEGLIEALAEEFGRPEIPEDNLIDELTFALIKASKSFSPDWGETFDDYKESFMREHIRSYVEDYMFVHETASAAKAERRPRAIAGKGNPFEREPCETDPSEEDQTEGEDRFIENEKTLSNGIFAFFAGCSIEDEFDDFISAELVHMKNAKDHSSEGIECAKNFLLLMYYGYDFDKYATGGNRDKAGSPAETAEDFLDSTLKNLEEKFRAEGLEDFAAFKRKKRLWPFLRKSLMTAYMGEAAQIIAEYILECLNDLMDIGTDEYLMYDAVSEDIICFVSRPASKILQLRINAVLKSDGLEMQNIKDFLRRYKSPKAIVDYLDSEIAGQYDAKWAVAITFYRHLVRVRSGKKQRPSDRSLLLCGPSGTAKTALFKALKRISPVNIATLPCTELSPSGYKGGDIGEILNDLLKGKHDLVLFDEVDKICTKGTDAEYWQAIQAVLLKPLDGDPVISGKNKSVDTQDLLLCFAGAFNGFDNTSERRVVGFGQQSVIDRGQDASKKFDYVDRLNELGMKDELIGRMHMIERTWEYSVEDYISIAELKLGKWCCDQYETYGCRVAFSDEAIRIAAVLEVNRKSRLGARGLVSRMTSIAEYKMYRDGLQDEVVITAEDVA